MHSESVECEFVNNYLEDFRNINSYYTLNCFQKDFTLR
jgi:hypothetical protein